MGPTCTVCKDTHRMLIGGEDDAREVMCTYCPRPCQKCRQGGNGPYCSSTPCVCACHPPVTLPDELAPEDEIYPVYAIVRDALRPPPVPREKGLRHMLRSIVSRFFERAPMSKISELVQGIKEAREAGLEDVERKLQKKLDAILGEDAEPSQREIPRATRTLAPENASGWLNVPAERFGEGEEQTHRHLGTARGDAQDIPKRSSREIARADRYFNEAEHQLAEDFEELNNIFDGAHVIPDREE